LKSTDERGRQFTIQCNRRAYKWQRARMSTHGLDRFKNQSRFHIQLAISEALFRACMPIMDLIGMQHHHLAWCTDLRVASVVEGLDASGRQADRIGVVAVLLIGMPLKPCF